VFLEIPNCRAICACGTFSLTCNLRIKAQSSKVITFPSWVGAHFSTVTSAQFSTVIDNRKRPHPVDSGPVSLRGCHPISFAMVAENSSSVMNASVPKLLRLKVEPLWGRPLAGLGCCSRTKDAKPG
jgi:hypothetical protein